jgi:transposase
VLTDERGRPRLFLLAPGNLHDVIVAPCLIALSGPLRRLIADKAYDTNAFRQLLAERGILAVIPSSARRNPVIPHDPQIYRQRNRIERMFGRLKDFRRIATRYDKLATNYLAGIVIAAAITWWT